MTKFHNLMVKLHFLHLKVPICKKISSHLLIPHQKWIKKYVGIVRYKRHAKIITL